MLVAVLPQDVYANEIGENVEIEANSNESIYQVEYIIDSQWDTGYNGTVIITNTSDKDIHNWMIKYNSTDKIENIWNGIIHSYENEDYIIKNVGWNQDIKVGESISFGFTASYSEQPTIPSEYELLGIQKVVSSGDYEIEYIITSNWDDGYTVEVSIKNISNKVIEDWQITFDMSKNINNIWNAVIESHENGIYTIRNNNHNGNINIGENVMFGFQVVTSEGEIEYPNQYNITLMK